MSANDEEYPPLTEQQQQWVTDNMDMAIKYVVSNFKPRSAEARENLIAVANLALVVAASRFNPDVGVKFFTYARHWLFKMLTEYIGKDYTIRPTWEIIRTANTPDILANAPLTQQDEDEANLIDLLGIDEDGYDEIERNMFAEWVRDTVLPHYSKETAQAWAQWRTDGDVTGVNETSWANVFTMNDEIIEGLQ